MKRLMEGAHQTSDDLTSDDVCNHKKDETSGLYEEIDRKI